VFVDLDLDLKVGGREGEGVREVSCCCDHVTYSIELWYGAGASPGGELS
jgi:hypothetical protein